ncbi:MAG: tetratricopeptide repeat protein [Acidobacteriota bacterium]
MIRSVCLFLAALPLLAVHPCQSCHPAQVSAFARTPMGNAIAPAQPTAPGSFGHSLSQSRFESFTRDGRLWHRIERGSLSAEYPIDWQIGYGAHAAGYLVRIGEALFQSPAALYRDNHLWAAAPGYERHSRLDFDRRVTTQCLDCHSSGDAANPQPISCDQCHGNPAAHLARPSRANISNPSRLAPAARDSVCERCHLTGETRIGPLTIVYDRPRQDLRVVSHVEQLALSECARQSSGKLWCGSCHASHGPAINVTATCRSCHSSLSPAHPVSSQTCASCHMPRRPASDGGHSAFTDHRIQSRPTPASSAPAQLRVWRDAGSPFDRERALGLASIEIGERDGAPELIQNGYRRLAALIARLDRDPEVLSALGMVLFLKDQKADARKLLRTAVSLRPNDPSLREKLALIEKSLGDTSAAVTHLEQAVRLDPFSPRAWFLLADCQPTQRRAILSRFLRLAPQSLLAREALLSP